MALTLSWLDRKHYYTLNYSVLTSVHIFPTALRPVTISYFVMYSTTRSRLAGCVPMDAHQNVFSALVNGKGSE